MESRFLRLLSQLGLRCGSCPCCLHDIAVLLLLPPPSLSSSSWAAHGARLNRAHSVAQCLFQSKAVTQLLH